MKRVAIIRTNKRFCKNVDLFYDRNETIANEIRYHTIFEMGRTCQKH